MPHLIGVLKPYVAGVLEGGDWFDEQILSDKCSWSDGVSAVAQALRSRRVDLAVLFPNSFRSALTVWLGGCRRRIGYARYGRSRAADRRLTPSATRTADSRRAPSSTPTTCSPRRPAVRVRRIRWNCSQHPPTSRPPPRCGTWRLWATSRGHLSESGAAFGAAKHWPTRLFRHASPATWLKSAVAACSSCVVRPSASWPARSRPQPGIEPSAPWPTTRRHATPRPRHLARPDQSVRPSVPNCSSPRTAARATSPPRSADPSSRCSGRRTLPGPRRIIPPKRSCRSACRVVPASGASARWITAA